MKLCQTAGQTEQRSALSCRFSRNIVLKQETAKEACFLQLICKNPRKQQASSRKPGRVETLFQPINLNYYHSTQPQSEGRIPLQIWSETWCWETKTNNLMLPSPRDQLYGCPLKILVLFIRSQVHQAGSCFFSAEMFNPGQTLVRLQDLFIDVDASETLEWETEVMSPQGLLNQIDQGRGETG